MILRSTLLYFLSVCLAINSSIAQTNTTKVDTLLIGIWKGTSLCQVKNSPCHDEMVVYHISKNKGVDSFYIDAGKIINGVEEDMGTIACYYNAKANQLIATVNRSIWTFNIEGTTIEGTLLQNGVLYRKIKIHKQQ